MDRKDLKIEEFNKAVKPIHDWLNKYGHPHMKVIIEQDRVEVVEGIFDKKMEVLD